jgi:MFS family permease
LRERQVPVVKVSQSTPTASAGSNRIFRFLLLAILLSAMSISVERLGLSLTMKGLHYSAGAISNANVIGGLITIPIVLWFGKLSDRLGRKFFLLLGYLLAGFGGLTLLFAGHLWHFWLVAAATLIARSISASLASALATDILPPAAIGRSLPWVSTASWIASVIGFAASGIVIDLAGAASLFAIAVLLSLGSAGLLTALPSPTPVLTPSARWTGIPSNPATCGADNASPS